MKPIFLQFQTENLDIAGWFIETSKSWLPPAHLISFSDLQALQIDNIAPHHDSQPALIICEKNKSGKSPFQKMNSFFWYQKGLLHREEDPAQEVLYGTTVLEQRWFTNGELHRIGEPAVRYFGSFSNNKAEYYVRNIRHNASGPAVVGKNNEYWLAGWKMREETWREFVKNGEIEALVRFFAEAHKLHSRQTEPVEKILSAIPGGNQVLKTLLASKILAS